MSCSTLNQQPVRMTVSAGALPEGFCPASMQELFDAMIQRLIVTPNQTFTSFAQGSVEPTSNVGPWLKDCEEWFVWDDATGRYTRMQVKGAFNELTVFETTGTFTVPDSITRLKVELWGGGGGGHDTEGAIGGAGGGGGAYALGILNVLPGQIIPVVVGLGGIGGTPGTDGGDSTFLTVTAGGGKGGATPQLVGAGGTHNGATYGVNGQSGGVGNTVAPGAGGDAGGGGGSGGLYIANIATGSPVLADGTIPGGGGAAGKAGLQPSFAGAHGRILVWT